MTSPSPFLLVENPQEGITRITFNRPERRNAFTFQMYRELLGLLRELRYDTATRVLVLTGAGSGFCSGQDIKEKWPVTWAPDGVGQLHRELYTMQEVRELPLAMRSMPQPIIAAVNGAVAGIGFMLALASDLAIAGASASFVNAFHSSSIGSEGGVSYLLPRAVGSQHAAEILFTGRPIRAAEAAAIGLVLRTVPDASLMTEVLELASSMTANTPLDNWLTKQALYAHQDSSSFANAVDFDTRGVILARMTGDAQERRTALQEHRAPEFRHE